MTSVINGAPAPTLTIGTSVIHQYDGLYSLNDLHKASGGAAIQRPGEFIRNQQTQGLISEIQNAGIPAFESRRGIRGGTYACRELLIAYAAWISPAFHLKVLRVFLERLETVPAPAAPLTITTQMSEQRRQALLDKLPSLPDPHPVTLSALEAEINQIAARAARQFQEIRDLQRTLEKWVSDWRASYGQLHRLFSEKRGGAQ